MRGRCLAAACMIACTLGALPAWARQPTSARIALLMGGRENVGALGDHYLFGYVIGGEAGIQRGLLGADWSMLFGTYESSRLDDLEPELFLTEMGFAFRARVGLGKSDGSAFAYFRAGMNLVRTNTPVPPEGRKDYWGPAGGAGLEFLVFDAFTVAMDGRYSVITNGPSGMTLLLSIGLRSK